MSGESTLGTFIAMMDQFINEMIATFPNESKLRVYGNSFNMIKKSNPRKILELFMESVGPFTQQIMAKDESVMLDSQIPLCDELNLPHIWTTPGITNSTKEAIWAHLNTLLMFGTTINNIPSGLMSGIEKLASDYASQMGDSPEIDPKMIMAGLQSMIGNMQSK